MDEWMLTQSIEGNNQRNPKTHIARASCLTSPLLLWVLVGMTIVGCDRPNYHIVPVSGAVTLDKNPLEDAHITFQPIAQSREDAEPGPGSWGRTDKDGRFTLETIDPVMPGAVVGHHRVTIVQAHRSWDPNRDEIHASDRETLPRRYWDGSLQFEVPRDGTQQADFDLDSR